MLYTHYLRKNYKVNVITDRDGFEFLKCIRYTFTININEAKDLYNEIVHGQDGYISSKYNIEMLAEIGCPFFNKIESSVGKDEVLTCMADFTSEIIKSGLYDMAKKMIDIIEIYGKQSKKGELKHVS